MPDSQLSSYRYKTLEIHAPRPAGYKARPFLHTASKQEKQSSYKTIHTWWIPHYSQYWTNLLTSVESLSSLKRKSPMTFNQLQDSMFTSAEPSSQPFTWVYTSWSRCGVIKIVLILSCHYLLKISSLFSCSKVVQVHGEQVSSCSWPSSASLGITKQLCCKVNGPLCPRFDSSLNWGSEKVTGLVRMYHL